MVPVFGGLMVSVLASHFAVCLCVVFLFFYLCFSCWILANPSQHCSLFLRLLHQLLANIPNFLCHIFCSVAATISQMSIVNCVLEDSGSDLSVCCVISYPVMLPWGAQQLNCILHHLLILLQAPWWRLPNSLPCWHQLFCHNGSMFSTEAVNPGISYRKHTKCPNSCQFWIKT